MKKYFKLFSCCIPVKGAKLSIICDLQRNVFQYIPNELYSILQSDKIDLDLLFNQYNTLEERETLKEYFDFFVKQEYGLITHIPNQFPKIDTKFEIPEYINNAIIDISENSNHNFKKIFQELEILGCKFLEIRFFSIINIDNLYNEILVYCKNSRLRAINLYVKYYESLTSELIFSKILSKLPTITQIIVHSSPYTKREKGVITQKILFLEDSINGANHCGNIGKEYFSINYPTFFESIGNNSCLNKKISVDSNGEIKNCPSMLHSFGNHLTKSLTNVAKDPIFQKVWSINKDQISVCKDCQFRYICTDCRAYLENPKDLYSKPLKCGYSPYENKWENWSENKTKQELFKKYQMEIK